MLHTPMKASVLSLVALLLPNAICSFQTTTIGFQNFRWQLHTRTHTCTHSSHDAFQGSIRTYSRSSLFASPAGKGFGSSTSTDDASMSKDDEKRKKTIEGLERWAKSVNIL